MSKGTAIKVENVGKTFRLPHEKNSSIKGALVNFYKRNKSYELQKALQGVSFDVKEGEFFGIVGRNGSGKSTLLKILAGIYSPSTGSTKVNGKLTPFIELGVGFNPELTGRENVFLNGALLGFNRKEMEKMYKKIVAFAELDRFMDQKLKNYSSGMQVRLAFSIAIRAKTDILLIDEVLAVGDTAFQKKCFDYFVKLKKQNTTIILVTHDMATVERFCDRVLVIDRSEDKGVMTPGEAATLYSKLNASNNTSKSDNNDEEQNSSHWGTGKVKLSNIVLSSGKAASQEEPLTINTGDPLKINFKFSSDKRRKLLVGIAFIDQFGVNISGPNST
jgi:ABC-2 type transport system ATP-binding protein